MASESCTEFEEEIAQYNTFARSATDQMIITQLKKARELVNQIVEVHGESVGCEGDGQFIRLFPEAVKGGMKFNEHVFEILTKLLAVGLASKALKCGRTNVSAHLPK